MVRIHDRPSSRAPLQRFEALGELLEVVLVDEPQLDLAGRDSSFEAGEPLEARLHARREGGINGRLRTGFRLGARPPCGALGGSNRQALRDDLAGELLALRLVGDGENGTRVAFGQLAAGERSSRATFSIRPSRSVSRSSASRITAGTVVAPASRAARQRRSPAISSYPPLRRGRRTTGWITPCERIESARPAVASWSKRFRGWRGFAWICSSGTCASWGASAPPIRTAKPRPRPRRGPLKAPSVAFDKLHRHLPVGLGAARAAVVVGDW